MTDPIQQFQNWFNEAEKAKIEEAEAMVLSTAAPTGEPSSRVVLFRGIIDGGFSFFTNYQSRKGGELEQNARAALLFYWRELGRQVRIEGEVKKLSEAASDQYWNSRPRGSQLSAAVSPQSKEVASVEELREKVRALERELSGRPVPRPKHWGGFHVLPLRLEFWVRGDDRMHERVVYLRQKGHSNGAWTSRRLGP